MGCCLLDLSGGFAGDRECRLAVKTLFLAELAIDSVFVWGNILLQFLSLLFGGANCGCVGGACCRSLNERWVSTLCWLGSTFAERG